MLRVPALLAVLFLLPAAAQLSAADGGPPAPVGTTERVVNYGWGADGDGWCHSTDPGLGLVGLAFGSSVTHTPVEGGTQYDIHLESIRPDAACSPLDISFVSDIAPWTTAYDSGTASSPCGATGYAALTVDETGRHMTFRIDVPASCGAAVSGQITGYLSLHSLHPSPYAVCLPVHVATNCVGAWEASWPRHACANGQSTAYMSVSDIVTVRRECDRETGEAVVTVGYILGNVWIEARADSCTIHVFALGITDDPSVACPDAVGDAIYGADWGSMLP